MSTPGTTAHLCVDARDEVRLVPFMEGIRLLGIPRQTAERMLRRRDKSLPAVLYLDGRRHFRGRDIAAALAARAEISDENDRVR